MKNTEKVLVAFLSLLIVLLIFVGVLKLLNEIYVLDNLLMESTDISGMNSQIANPASSYCLSHGGKLDIRNAEDGSQTGYCVFKNGNECEEWTYYRGECSDI